MSATPHHAGRVVHTLKAFNTAKEAENKIHDDTVARRFGFSGGFVPGVEVYGYLSHAAAAAWGKAWLDRGTLNARFHKPVYDKADVSILEITSSAHELTLLIESNGVNCAEGVATLPVGRAPEPEIVLYPRRELPTSVDREVANTTNLAPNTVLGTYDLCVSPSALETYLEEVSEPLALYTDEALVPSGLILRTANWVLSATVRLGPWIHVSSAVTHHAAARLSEPLETRGKVVRNWEHKGHRFVEVDAVTFGEGGRAILSVLHTAIWEPRQVRGDAPA